MHETLATITTSRPADKRAGRGEPQPINFLVDRGVLLDVNVPLRYVRLGLVVVVVADEVMDSVVRKESLNSP